jgi:hypothetical protein
MSSLQQTLDASDCVVCYEKKASCFCDGCKHSSGVCFDCHHEIKYKAFGYDNFRTPAPCVICKKPMNRATMNHIFENDLLLDGLSDTVEQVSIEKTKKLSEIIWDAE